VKSVCADSRAWLFDLMSSLSAEAGAKDAGALAHQLMLLYDGASVSAQMDDDLDAARVARAIAAELIPAG
jgi:hypothetical protein